MKEKIVISLTSIRLRLSGLEAVVRSLAAQEQPADELRLYLSDQPYLLDDGIKHEQLPPLVRQLEQQGRLSVHYVENTGPYRKLLPCLQDFRGSADTLIITADDDTVYPPDWVKVLVEAYHRYRQVIAFRGRLMRFEQNKLLSYEQWPFLAAGRGDPKLCFPTGKDGVLFSPLFFPDKVFDPVYKSLAPTNDDIWFRFMTLAKGIGARIVASSGRFKSLRFPENDTLYKDQGNKQHNDRMIRDVIDYLAEQGLYDFFAEHGL